MDASLVVTGASDHYGRAELVTLAVQDGVPVFLDRRRARLIDDDLPGAPYHHEALELDLDAAIALVERVRRSVAEHARAALSALVDELRVSALVLRSSPFERLPDSLAELLTSRRLTNAADGMLYRESLAEAAAALGLHVRRYPRRSDPMPLAAQAMGAGKSEVAALITQFGREAGPPWRKDHKVAAAAALMVVGDWFRG